MAHIAVNAKPPPTDLGAGVEPPAFPKAGANDGSRLCRSMERASTPRALKLGLTSRCVSKSMGRSETPTQSRPEPHPSRLGRSFQWPNTREQLNAANGLEAPSSMSRSADFRRHPSAPSAAVAPSSEPGRRGVAPRHPHAGQRGGNAVRSAARLARRAHRGTASQSARPGCCSRLN
jgi:hypothetical protein